MNDAQINTEFGEPPVVGKKWYASKTIWLNVIYLVGAVVTHFTGIEVNADAAVNILAVANVVLRLVTKDKIGIK